MIKQIFLAGGCFWGTQQYFENIKGIIETQVGYANGNSENPTYEQVCHQNTGHAETIMLQYDNSIISLNFILLMYYEVINPTAINRQGGDVGAQYRTGIYYTDENDYPIILSSIAQLQKAHTKPIAIEVLPLKNYSKAEEYHQHYLDKNPNGYCHIKAEMIEKAKLSVDKSLKYVVKANDELAKELTPMQFNVTQKNATEPPFKNEYYNNFEKGIYVDITTGEPLFISSDKFESGCGWPAFSKPIDIGQIQEITDTTHYMQRTEVRSKGGNAHLGHVFNDGPQELGGIRYCINSASLKFISQAEMENQGYGEYLPLIK